MPPWRGPPPAPQRVEDDQLARTPHAETANTFLRGSSLGSWDHADNNVYTATYSFFRYNPDGTFKSIAEALNKVELSGDAGHFTAAGTITDYDAAGNQISLGCVTQAARRLTALDN